MAIFDGDFPNMGVKCRSMKKSRFSTNITLYLRNDTIDRAIVTIESE